MKTTLLTLILCFFSTQTLASDSAEPLSLKAYESLMTSISNWGRWGKHDQLGTLNLITPERRVAAAALVKTGEAVSLSLELNKEVSATNANPFKHTLVTDSFGGHDIAGDQYSVEYHGFAHSHMDGLPHYSRNGKLYNGVDASALKPDGARQLGIENAGRAGVVTRGVLVDMPAFFGVEFLTPGTAITASDLEAWEKKHGVTIGSGDVLLLRTGRWMPQPAPRSAQPKIAGLHATVAQWLRDRDVAAIGSDAISDVMPSGMKTLATPLHELVLVGLGMPIFDNLDLDELATVSAREKRSTFLFTAAPLRVAGGTGSPLNPIAVF
ncbi:MAG: cyclase family protein [Halioglobus sp.]